MAMPLSEVLRRPNEREPLDPMRFHQPPRLPRLWVALAVIAGLVLALIALSPLLAHAQPIPGADNVNIVGVAPTLIIPVQDQAAEQSLADIDNQAQTIAKSVTTAGCAGVWTDQTNYLTGLMQILASGVIGPQTFASLYLGYVDPGPNSIYTAETVTNQTLKADAAALGVVQDQASNFQAESSALTRIERCSAGATAMLAAVQANTESNLADAEQLRLTRQLLMTMIDLVAVQGGEVLNEKAQSNAGDAVNLNGGTMP
jgi:hypothetical protein